MSLTLHSHPLSSYGQKVRIALYENDTPFTPHLVNLGDPESGGGLKKLWPAGKLPVLQDHAHGHTIPESTIIIEYLDRFYPGRVRFVPDNPERAWQVRLADRFFDLHVQAPMQKIVIDRLRPAGQNDPFGVEHARGQLRTALDILETDTSAQISTRDEDFSLADCSAAPALYYADKVMPFRSPHKRVGDYFDRLMARPSFARAVKEAEPYLHLFPNN
jgi:glutathione S-transferase